MGTVFGFCERVTFFGVCCFERLNETIVCSVVRKHRRDPAPNLRPSSMIDHASILASAVETSRELPDGVSFHGERAQRNRGILLCGAQILDTFSYAPSARDETMEFLH